MAKRKTVPVSISNRNAVIAEVNRCIAIANEAFSRRFDRPTIEYKLSGSTGGTATYSTNAVNLNSILLEENGDTFISRTVGHEVAHLIAYKVYGNAGHGHGLRWKSVMMLFGITASRCHSYNVRNAVSHREKHVYVCTGCNGSIILGAVRHNKVIKGKMSYKHCLHGKLDYIGSAGKVSTVDAYKAIDA